jgi:hypothetical protein
MDSFARSENCLNNDSPINDTNTQFYVQNAPIAPGGLIQLTVDNQLISSPYTDARVTSITEQTGQFVLATAPTTSVFANYYYYLFPDATWQEFVSAALEELNFYNATTQTLDDAVSAIPDVFLGAVKGLTRAWFASRIATQTGLWYNQRLQERIEDRDSISKKYADMSDRLRKSALLMRDDAYRGSGSKESPQMAITQMIPRVWTPRR